MGHEKDLTDFAILALLAPSIALAATEFSLGGFIKLDTFWDSTQEGKNTDHRHRAEQRPVVPPRPSSR